MAKKQRLRLLRQANRLKQLGAYDSKQSTQVGKPTGELEPPAPPLALTPALAADPETAIEVLWRIARDEPELRRWLVINPKADASLLEYVSQAGGPGVKQALTCCLTPWTRWNRNALGLLSPSLPLLGLPPDGLRGWLSD